MTHHCKFCTAEIRIENGPNSPELCGTCIAIKIRQDKSDASHIARQRMHYAISIGITFASFGGFSALYSPDLSGNWIREVFGVSIMFVRSIFGEIALPALLLSMAACAFIYAYKCSKTCQQQQLVNDSFNPGHTNAR